MTVRAPAIGTDTDSAETFRLALCGLWAPASALNARTGVTSVPTLTGTGSLTANISAFTCVIDGTSNALQGAYPVANDNVAGITITAGSSQARIDLICLQIQDNDYDGSGQHRGIQVVVAGTPSGSPVAPATPANAIPLWTLPVPALASSVTFSTATAVYPFAAARGGIIPVRNAADKPAVAAGDAAYRHRMDVGTGGASPLEWSTDGITYTPVSGAPAALVKVGSFVAGTAVSQLLVSVPANTYSSLLMTWTARLSANTSTASLQVKLNADTGSNYRSQSVEGFGTSTSAGDPGATDGITIGEATGTAQAAGAFAGGTFTILNPNNTGQHKTIAGTASNAALTGSAINYTGAYGGTWANTAAVTSVALYCDTGPTLATGSTLTVYGLV